MSDLRDRIAAALRNVRGDLTYEALADAVIRELKLHREVEIAQAGIRIKVTAHRYVTEWENDDSRSA
jgi:hypothetical protein